MSNNKRLYIAGVGMITPVGANAEMTAAAIKAGVSGYAISDFYNQNGEPITMASVPGSAFSQIDAVIGEGDRYNERHDRVTRMAINSIRQACARRTTNQPVPLILSMPEQQSDDDGLIPLIENLEENCKPWINPKLHRSIFGGRASGMEAIDFAFRYFHDLPYDYILIGGSDSHQDYPRLTPLDNKNRLLTETSMDGFAPGEAACFLLLTQNLELAMIRNGHVVGLKQPGIAEEPGHLCSEEPYLGDGLDQAFKNALIGSARHKLDRIFSSMNGENHWAKEYGVAFTRNETAFSERLKLVHPADSLGDVGSATSPLLIALAAEHLHRDHSEVASLVYSSSDSAKRGAVVVERFSVKARN